MPLAETINEPLVLADGTEINPSDGKVVARAKEFVEVPTNKEAQALVVRTRRHLADIPAQPNQINAISLVLTYTLYGLAMDEIVIATSFTVDQIDAIRKLDAYADMLVGVQASLVESGEEDVRTILSVASGNAARRVVGLLESDSEAIQLSAGRDILDRAGHRPADVVEHRHSLDGTLRIEHVTRDTGTNVPVVDAEFVEMKTGD